MFNSIAERKPVAREIEKSLSPVPKTDQTYDYKAQPEFKISEPTHKRHASVSYCIFTGIGESSKRRTKIQSI